MAAQTKSKQTSTSQETQDTVQVIPTQVQVIDREELITLDMRAALRENEQKKKALHKRYSAEKKVPVTLAPSYANHFGKVMYVTINGISVAVPVNGMTYEIPETFAAEVHRRRLAVDAIERKQKAMADISKNFDGRSPGQLPLF